MKLTFAVILSVFLSSGTCLGQFEPISGELRDEWENGLGYIFPTVQHFPVQELSEDLRIIEIRFGGVERGFDSLDVCLIGLTEGTPLLLASGGYSGMYNFAKSWAAFDEITGLIEIIWQMPGSATWYSAEYSWDFGEDDLLLVACESGDPSWDAIAEIEILLAAGEIEQAESVLYDIFYPHHYYRGEEMFCSFLRAAHAEAIELCSTGDQEGAARLFDHLPEFWTVPDWDGSALTADSYQATGLEEYMPLEEFNAIAADYRDIVKCIDD